MTVSVRKAMQKVFIFTTLLALLSGCSSTPKVEVASYDTNQEYKFPLLSVFYDDPSEVLNTQCTDFNATSAFQYCYHNEFSTQYYWQALDNSNMFEDVLFAEKESDFKLAIATVSLQSESVGDITQAAISGASLLLIPMTNEQEVRAEVSLYWRDFKIKQYDYQLPYVTKVSLFNQIEDSEKAFANQLMSRFIADAQKDNVFSSSTIAQALGATDYAKDVAFPAHIANFSFAGQFAFFDPMLGVMATYLTPDYVNDKVDVFVYPIRRTEYLNSEAALSSEARNVADEISYVVNKQNWTDLELTEPEKVSVDSADGTIEGIKFGGRYTADLGEEAFLSVFLFAHKDKFIKFRATFPAQFLGEHVQGVVNDIHFPGESLFMAKVREYGKKQEREQASEQ